MRMSRALHRAVIWSLSLAALAAHFENVNVLAVPLALGAAGLALAAIGGVVEVRKVARRPTSFAEGFVMRQEAQESADPALSIIRDAERRKTMKRCALALALVVALLAWRAGRPWGSKAPFLFQPAGEGELNLLGVSLGFYKFFGHDWSGVELAFVVPFTVGPAAYFLAILLLP